MIVKKNLSEQIYDDLKSNILAQNIKYGEKLINRELQKKYGVSSTPVRDAINRLFRDGLLEDISNGGARVITFDIRAALEVNEIVACLNRDALALTVRKKKQEKVLGQLRDILSKQEQFIETPEYLDYDKQFHHTFFDYCGNSRLKELYREHDVLWDMHISTYHKNSEGTRKLALRQHEEVLRAYASGGYERAEQLIFTHFLDAVHSLEEKLLTSAEPETLPSNPF